MGRYVFNKQESILNNIYLPYLSFAFLTFILYINVMKQLMSSSGLSLSLQQVAAGGLQMSESHVIALFTTYENQAWNFIILGPGPHGPLCFQFF